MRAVRRGGAPPPPGLLTVTGLHGPTTPRSTSAATGRGCAAGCLQGRGTLLLWYELHAFSGEGLPASCLSPRSRARTHTQALCVTGCVTSWGLLLDLKKKKKKRCSNDSMPDVRFLSCLYSYHGRFTANEVIQFYFSFLSGMQMLILAIFDEPQNCVSRNLYMYATQILTSLA